MTDQMTLTPENPLAMERLEGFRQDILHLRPHLRVAHHLPGRLRVQVRPGIEAARVLARLTLDGAEQAVRHLPGVRSTRLNAMAGSLVLEYDQRRLAPGLLNAFFTVESREEADGILDTLFNH